MTRCARPSLSAFVWLACSAAARAAGGHFDVDDAAVLDPGHCQVETWLTRAPAAPATLFHLGPGCRVGPVELGVNYERISTATATATASRGTLGPQLKWVVDLPVGPRIGHLSAGIAWIATYDLGYGGRPVHTLYLPATWAVTDRAAINANLGADWNAAGVRLRRVGVSGEWVAHEKLTLLAERVKFAGDWTSRLGARFMLGEAIGIDLSAARVGARATRVYAIGLNHEFAR